MQLSKADLMALVETGRDLAAEVNLDLLLEKILTKATSLTNSTGGSVILFDEQREALYFAHAIGENAGKIMERWGNPKENTIPLHGSIAGTVLHTGKPITIDRVEADMTHFKAIDQDTGKTTDSMVCVPMTVMGKRIGVVQILNKRDDNYTKRDLTLLEHFASQAAIALQNARLFEGLLAHMGLYVTRHHHQRPAELLQEITRPPHTEVLSVLFADMRGFTQLCNVLPHPEQTQKLLNDLLGMLADTVMTQDGVVNKFLGDGVLALFRGENHAIRAVKCADAMVHNFSQLRKAWDEQTNVPLGFLDLGIGITTDEVILCSIGSDQVRDFTAVGIPVNLAANLMEQARNGLRILIDKMTYRAAKQEITDCDGPETFTLKKPGQTVGHPYERYHVKSLTSKLHQNQSASEPGDLLPTSHVHEVFISYSHKDASWLEKIKTHLKPYLRSGDVKVWDDTHIQPGATWREEINQALTQAKVAVLLVSPNFLDSDFIHANELLPLLQARKDSGLHILWIPLSFSSFEETKISEFQAGLDPSHPLDSLSPPDQNKALVHVCKKIKNLVL